MSSQMIPFMPTTERNDFHSTTLRGLKVVLLLVGLSLCLQVMETSPEWKALVALGEPIEPIVLHPSENIQLHCEMVFPQMHMFTSPGFQKVTDDKHIWAYMQSVDVGDRSGLVYYFKFRNRSDTNLCREKIQTSGDFMASHECRQFGLYTVLVIMTHDDGDPSPFYEAVFKQIKENYHQSPQSRDVSDHYGIS
jgi:hypothetical protein